MAFYGNKYGKKPKTLTEKDRRSVEDALKLVERWRRPVKFQTDFVRSNGTVYSETGWYRDESHAAESAWSMLECLGQDWKISGQSILYDGRCEPQTDN